MLSQFMQMPMGMLGLPVVEHGRSRGGGRVSGR